MLMRVLLAALCAAVVVVHAVDRSKFRTCADTGFCNAFRAASGNIKDTHYKIDPASITQTAEAVNGKILVPESMDGGQLNLHVYPLSNGAFRVKISEDGTRWQPNDLLMQEGLAPGSFSMMKPGDANMPAALKRVADASAFIALSSGEQTLAIYTNPMKIELYRGNALVVTANDRNLLHYEKKQGEVPVAVSQKQKEFDRHQGKTVVDYGEDGLAIYEDGSKEERRDFKDFHAEDEQQHHDHPVRKGDRFGGHTDPQAEGPVSVGIDFAFPFAEHVYGIPEHATTLSLPTTAAGPEGAKPAHFKDPFRMYNLDVFEYEMNEPMALYGNIPIMLAHGLVDGHSTSSGIFWFNPSETFIDISDSNIRSDAASGTAPFYKTSHWISESGEVDFFMFGGSAPGEIMKQFTAIVGRQQLPPLFALGYHQCRWNYRDERDVAQVEGKFEELDFPMDVIWLDIDHTDGMRYFTWDKSHFPTPIEMQKKLSAHGRKLVSIVDPHLKRDNNYRIHQIATQKGYYVKNSEGKDFDGWCWPGSSSYLDFTSPAVREWWAEQFSLENYEGTTMDCFTWNDMNEPSVFNGPEVSMPKDAKNLDGVEHRHWHNLYGIYMQQATADGHVMRSPKGSDPTLKKRSFVLSRSFWAGSQRFGAIWTGDNAATWDQLKMASPMILSINLAGLSFSGSDAGGFFHEPTPELFTRWYQAASFTPFFRGHAHHDTKRREPWVYGEPHTTIHRNFAMLRYALLPLWYTAFYEAYSEGLPVMRTMFAEFPSDVDTFTLEDQWMIGDTLLVKPVTDAGHTQSDVYLPGPEAWYDLFTLKKVDASKSGTKSAVAAPIETMPVFIRAGKVVSRKMRLRRSASLMHYDPYTLTVVPDSAGKATGSLYMDDETSMAHETHNMFVYRELAFADNKLTCSAKTAADTSASPSQEVSAASSAFKPVNTVERIELAEQSKAPKKVVVTHADGATEDLQFVYDGQRRVTTVKKPNTVVAQDWVIAFEF